MDEAPQRGRRRLAYGLAGGLAALGAALLVWALWGFLRVTISERAPGPTAGGDVTAMERCSRGVPADLAQACRAAVQHRAAAARRPLALAAAGGGILMALAVGVAGSGGRHKRRRVR